VIRNKIAVLGKRNAESHTQHETLRVADFSRGVWKMKNDSSRQVKNKNLTRLRENNNLATW